MALVKMSPLKMAIVKYAWLILALYLSLFFLQKTNLVTSDLGRHLANGREILQAGRVFETNFYSYTHPDFPTINHHWFFGIIIFLIFKIGGFGSLTIFNALLGFTAFALVFYFSQKKYGFVGTFGAGVALLPLLTSRIEIRPETLSLFFSAIFYVALAKFFDDKLSFKFLLPFLLICQIIWVNSHLFFVFGVALAGYFWLKSLLIGHREKFTKLSLLIVVLTSSWLLNPAGFAGAIEPFGILGQYGYSVIENQPIWFLLKILPQPIYWYLLVAGIGFMCLQIWAIFQQKKSKSRTKTIIADFLFLLLLTGATFYIYRLINFYALLILPLSAKNLSLFLAKYSADFKNFWNSTFGAMFISFAGFIILVWMVGNTLIVPRFGAMGIGIYEQNNASAEFFKNHQISGPIFNNYDIGGYLIYHLFPDTKVFIDNRPEAYPEKFFTEKYIPAQLEEEIWQKLFAEYDFNVIYFHRNDLTNWGQDFLVRLIKDETWIPVFVDNWTIILVRNTTQNQPVIERYQLPAEIFGVSTDHH